MSQKKITPANLEQKVILTYFFSRKVSRHTGIRNFELSSVRTQMKLFTAVPWWSHSWSRDAEDFRPNPRPAPTGPVSLRVSGSCGLSCYTPTANIRNRRISKTRVSIHRTHFSFWFIDPVKGSVQHWTDSRIPVNKKIQKKYHWPERVVLAVIGVWGYTLAVLNPQIHYIQWYGCASDFSGSTYFVKRQSQIFLSPSWSEE